MSRPTLKMPRNIEIDHRKKNSAQFHRHYHPLQICRRVSTTHSSTDVTYKTYYSHDHKEGLRKAGHSKGISKLEKLLNQRDELDVRIRELSNELERVGFWSSRDGGGIFHSCWIADNDSAITDYNSSGLQGIGSPSRIRTKVVELLRQLSSDALDEMLRGKNTLARDLLSMLSEVRL